jgi:hypothetical protein
MAWQKIDWPKAGPFTAPMVTMRPRAAHVNQAARGLLGEKKRYSAFYDKERRAVGFALDPAGGFYIPTTGKSPSLHKVLDALGVEATTPMPLLRVTEPGAPVQFFISLPPRAKEKPE